MEKAKKDKKTPPEELSALEKCNETLMAGKPARVAGLTADEAEQIKGLMLLTMKPVIYAANVADADLATGNAMSKKVFDFAAAEGNKAVRQWPRGFARLPTYPLSSHTHALSLTSSLLFFCCPTFSPPTRSSCRRRWSPSSPGSAPKTARNSSPPWG